MSDAAGTDNPAFANEDECVSDSKLENGSQQQAALNQDRKSSADSAPVENGHQRSFISQHYVEPIKPSSEPCYKTETRIEVPADNMEKSVPEPKLNGVHGNGNNNDASFLNNSATSVQINESGKKEQIEAVNLELVSMRPYTSNTIQTKGQEACEVPTDPYEEYFVPVNEHRKYIRDPEAEVETTVAGVRFDLGPGVGREGLSLRDPAAGLVDYSHWLTALRGEKLYVTKDKRSRNSHWRRMAWGCALLVTVIAVIIAILAATGVFPIPATEPLENVKENNTRQFNEVQTAENREYVKNPPLSPPPLTSTFPPWPTTDETLFDFVSDALDGTLRLDDFNWNDDFNDIKSRVYRQVSSEIERHLGNILRQTDNSSVVKVYDINKEGEIRFRVSHPPRIVLEENQEFIEDVLRKNSNMIGEYHLNRLHVGKLIDQCEYGNLECTENCKYDYSFGVFVCTCKLGEILHQDGKTCVDDSDLSNVEMDDIVSQSSTEPIDDFQGRSRDPGAADFKPRHSNAWKNTDFKTGSAETDTSMTKPKTEHVNSEHSNISIEQQSEFIPTMKHVFDNDNFHWNHEHVHHSEETTIEIEPSAKLEPITEPELSVEPEPTAEPELTAEPEPSVELEPNTKPESSAEPESNVELGPSVESEPSAEPEPTISPEIIVLSKPTIKPESEFTAISEPTIKSEIAPEIGSTVEAESIIENESTTKLMLVTESASTIDETNSEIKSKTESHYSTTESYLKSKISEISDQPEFPVKAILHDDTSESSTQISLSDDASTTDVKFFIDLTDKSDNSKNDETFITTTTLNENPIDNDTLLQVIPLTSKNESKDINVETKITTMQSYTSKDDEIIESATIEAGLTTLNYNRDIKQNSDVNITSTKLKNHKESVTEQFTQNPNLQKDKESNSTIGINFDTNLSNVQNDNSSNSEHDLITKQKSGTDLDVFKQSSSTTAAITVPITLVEERMESTTEFMNNKRHSSTGHIHTIEINGVSNRNPETDNYTKVHETTAIPETTPTTDIFTQLIPGYRKELVPEPALQPNTPDSNEKNVIEHMPTTVFPKVPKNFAHNVEPLREPLVKSTDDEHIMLIPKFEQPVEIHAIIPQLIPEQATNKFLKAENFTTKVNNVEDTTSIDSSIMRSNENITHTNNNKHAIRPDEIQEYSTSHPLHPAVFPENSVDHFTGKSDDRPAEDMSPFLPDVYKEKESMKKPRLDKDEQDSPNPFETHIDDVIMHRPLIRNNANRVNETETKDLLNDVNSHSTNNKKKIDITKETTQNHEINTADDVGNNDNTNNTESKILNASHQNNSAKSIDNDETKSIINQKNGGFSEDKELKVIPLAVKDKSVDSISQTTMQPIDKKIESEVVTSAGKQVQEVGGITIESGVTSSEKPEENAVEDHYNDITDETLSKGYRHDNTGIPIKVIESKKAVLKDIDPIKISYNGPFSSLTTFDIIKKKNGTDEKISSNTTQSLMITKIDSVVNNQMEDGRLTTQEPVLPIEIQQEMSTTTDKVEITTVIDDGKHQENNTELPNAGQSDEKETVTAQMTTTQATLETKTTAQIPILPEELQTTESDVLSTTLSEEIPNEDKKMKAIDKTVSTDDANDATKKNEAEKENVVTPSDAIDTSERSMAATTMYESNISLGTGRKIEYDRNGQEIKSATESMIIETTPMMSITGKDIASGVEETTPIPNDVTTTEDVRPVTEMLDDTQPIIDYRILFTTIPPRPILLDPEVSEETLRVIPLEKSLSPESKKKPIDKKGFDKYKYKKEKDLNLENQNEDNVLTEKFDQTILSQTEPSTGEREELHDSVVSSDIDPNVPRFTVADKEGNIVSISKWKDTTSAAKSENKGTIAEMKPKNYPNFIPVSEEIIESAPVTEPYVIMRNYTRLTIIPNNTERTTANETTVEGQTNAKANDTIGQNVTFFSDQSNDHQEAEADRVTEESTMQTSPSNVEIENTTASSLFEFPFPENLSKCSTGQFQCVNGTSKNGAYCVPQSAKCDFENDCSDGSDEWNCGAEGCSGNFRCANGQCLKRHLVCNKIVDCEDGSDEHNCENWQCQSDEFKCSNGRCIPGLWQCNGRPDCEGHQDEYNCAETCGNNEYLCPTEKWCVPQAWHCNGVADCVNGEDEKLCDCALDQFKCQTGGCIPRVQVCDGIENCPDYSDEWSCLIANTTADQNLTKTETDNNTASEATRVPFLKIRQYDGDHQLVCSDGWSEEFSHSYCQALGFAGSDETIESFAWDRSQKILRLKTNPNYRLPLVTNLEEVEFCVSDKVIQVSCQEFTCGLHYAEEPTTRLAGVAPANEQWSSVALLKKSEEGICTASILGPMHALTSYSCIYSRNKENGGWQLFTGGNILKGNIVKNIIPYPRVKYNQLLYNNDIALIELREPLVLSRNVSAVCLPRRPIQPGQICVRVGWAFLRNGEMNLQQYLKFLSVPTNDSNKCNATSHYAGFITEHDICMDEDPCYNDEGAPLMCASESQSASERWEIQGLLSHHRRCLSSHPAIYSSLEPALLWLRETVPALQMQS